MKKWYLSKTIWLNVIAVVLYVLTALVDSKLFGENGLAFITGITAFLNIVLRFYTDKGLISLLEGFKTPPADSDAPLGV